MKTFEHQGRQGDILLVRVDKIPDEAKERATENERVVVAHGEVTGHIHSFCSARVTMYAVADEFTRNGCGYVVVRGKEEPMTHQEHDEIGPRNPGSLRVIRQRQLQDQKIIPVGD